MMHDYTVPGYTEAAGGENAIELTLDGDGLHFITTSPSENAYLFNVRRHCLLVL